MHDFNLLSPGLWYEKRKLAMNAGIRLSFYLGHALTAARLAQLGERRSAEREAIGSNPGWTNTQGL